MLPRIPSIVMRRYSTAPGIGGVAAATAIALFLSWICSIFYIRRRCTELALPVLPCGFDAGALRQIVRIGLPLGLNSALYSIGHIFLPMTSVSTVLYSSCKILPAQMGSANSAARPSTEPWVISTCADFR